MIGLTGPAHTTAAQLLDGPCCQARGACPALRKSLAAKPSVDMMGDALCYDGVTLCDPSGRVVQLSLVNQARRARGDASFMPLQRPACLITPRAGHRSSSSAPSPPSLESSPPWLRWTSTTTASPAAWTPT